jgi:DNA adenine methylase
MSTPRGPHKPISPATFSSRVDLWNRIIQIADFETMSFDESMDRAQQGDVIYCDPPYTHSQGIIYGAQAFSIDDLFNKIAECKNRGVYVMLSINGSRESNKRDISVNPPEGLFVRDIAVNCGTSMIDRLQNAGGTMENEIVYDRLMLTW